MKTHLIVWLADSVPSQSAGVQITTLWVLNAGYIAYSGIFRLDRRLSSYPFAVPADSNEPQAEGFLIPITIEVTLSSRTFYTCKFGDILRYSNKMLP